MMKNEQSAISEKSLSELFILYKQANSGPAPSSYKVDSTVIDRNMRSMLEQQYLEWRKLGDMDRTSAKITFVSKMKSIDPCYNIKGSVSAIISPIVTMAEAELQMLKC